jgi:ubiquinone/menaquinone biosynthesis C-methylase UbiE
MWAQGDYHVLVDRCGLREIGAGIVARAGVSPGMTVLDVATGTGATASAAVAAGAQVWALDLAWEMLSRGAKQIVAAVGGPAWVQGDAERLPFPDGTFDRVLSSLGVMFAENHEAAARELVRTCRTGGRIGLCSWTPEGIAGIVARIVASYHGQGCPAAMLWGTEDHVRSLFAQEPVTLEFERVNAVTALESADQYVRLLGDHSGPFVASRRRLSHYGRWEALCEELRTVLERHNTTPGRGWTAEQEYLVTIAHKQYPTEVPAGREVVRRVGARIAG